MQAEKRQQAADAAAALVTASVAESVVGSPLASGNASATASMPHTPTASTGGVTPRELRVRIYASPLQPMSLKI